MEITDMKLLRTKVWNWWDVWQLKWCAFLFGIAAGGYFHELVMPYVWIIIVVAVLLAVSPTTTYFSD
jgi:uncharacterized membrane protein